MSVYLTDVTDLMLRTAFIIVYVNQRKPLFLTVPVSTKGIAADHESGN